MNHINRQGLCLLDKPLKSSTFLPIYSDDSGIKCNLTIHDLAHNE